MNARTALAALAIVLSSLVFLGAFSQTEGDAGIVVKEVHLPDGRVTFCMIVNEQGEGPAMQCTDPR